MTVTVGIKALNEAKHIAAAIRSALVAVEPFGGEVVLADSGSSDATLDIARSFPQVRIVQLADVSQRCCGAGAQLAFQAANMPYFYLLDGDMILDPDFLVHGMAFLEGHREYAAVGGRVREVETANLEFALRAQQIAKADARREGQRVDVDRLDCGGLYRASAIHGLGYFADRNLHAFEEFELGARLVAANWKLARIDVPAVDHFGHDLDNMALLVRRMRSGYTGATGEVMRAGLAGDHWAVVARRFAHLRHGLIVIIWWGLLLATLLTGHMAGAGVLLLAPLAFLWWRRKRLSLAVYSYLNWNVTAIGLLQGLLRKRTPPDRPLAMTMLKEARAPEGIEA